MNLPQVITSNPLQLKNASDIMDELERARRANHLSGSTLVDWDKVEQMIISTYEQHGDSSALDKALLHQIIEERRNANPQRPTSQAFFAQTYYPLDQTSLGFVSRVDPNRAYKAISQYSKKERLSLMQKALTNHIPYTDAELLSFHQRYIQSTQDSARHREKHKKSQVKSTRWGLGFMLLSTVLSWSLLGVHVLSLFSSVVSTVLILMVYSQISDPAPEIGDTQSNSEDFQKLLVDLFVRYTRINNAPEFVITPPSLEQINRYYNGHYQPNLFVDESNPNVAHLVHKSSNDTVREIYTKWKIRNLPLRHLELQALLCLSEGKTV